MNLKIATRQSKLALAQTEVVIKFVKDKYGLECEKLLIKTEGDKKLDVSLDKIGGKGLFVKDIEYALLEEHAHAAVHSMKDVPYEIDDAFEIAAMPVREDVRDVFISADGTSFFDLPSGAVIGTSSNRRIAQIKALRPDLKTVPIRGNVQTRLSKIETENLAGIVLAAAGIKRLNLEEIITDYFEPYQFVPAVGQGAIGIEILKTSTSANIFKGLDNNEVRICVEAERSFMKKLDVGCHTTIGAFASIDGKFMNIIGIFQVNGVLVKKSVSGDKSNYIELGEILADKILKA